MEGHKTSDYHAYSRREGETMYKITDAEIEHIYPQMGTVDIGLAVATAFRDITAILFHMKFPRPEYVSWSTSALYAGEIHMIWPNGQPRIIVKPTHGSDAMIWWVDTNEAPLIIHSYPKQLETDTLPRLIDTLSPK
jgi:hypothetical protein